MWNASEHTDDDNLRWCHLRAIEWANWPIFVSQSMAPVALLFISWKTVMLYIVVANFIWALLIRHRIVIAWLARCGVYLAKLKWLTCPISACILFFRGSGTIAALALFWPLVTLFLPFLTIVLGSAKIGSIQKNFMRSLGYERNPVIPETAR